MPDSTLGISPEVEAPKKKRNWLKIGLTALMGLIVIALIAMVASSTYSWLFAGPH
jgi:hypothetical protein